MQQILVIGAGKIGQLVATLLNTVDDYVVHLADLIAKDDAQGVNIVSLDANDTQAVAAFVNEQQITVIVSCLPYFMNVPIALVAKAQGCHYFDLTEDMQVSATIRALGEHSPQVFAPQCGLAPGFVSIVAKHLMGYFSACDNVYLRVGALPQHAHHALKYALTWSTEGLINEYGNLCYGIVNETRTALQPLGDLETLEIGGMPLEAFNTSGGLGTLDLSYAGQVKNMNYKSLRYPGHCEKMRFLMRDLKLNEDRATLKRILENAVPRTQKDIVIIYVLVTGWREGQLYEKNYVKRCFAETLLGKKWTAIQITTATSVCAVIDLVLQSPGKYQGTFYQEGIDWQDFLTNRFGSYYGKDNFFEKFRD